MPFVRLIPRYFAAFVISTIVIAGAQILKGHATTYSVTQGVIWGGISSTIYILAYYFNIRNKPTCAINIDSPPRS